ncbi:MAG: T9SS type A sorting domain-containing protein [Saprospiraceae bacterium]
MGSYEITFQLNVIHNDCADVIVEAFVDDNETFHSPSTDVFIGQFEAVLSENECYGIKISITDPEKVLALTSHPYLFFVINGTCSSPPPSVVDIDAVMDNFQGCNLLNISFTHSQCGDLCMNLQTNCETECNGDRFDDPNLDDCYMQIEWYPNDEYNSNELIDECYFAGIESRECCFTPPDFGTYYAQVLVQYQLNGETVGGVYNVSSDFEVCSDITVSSSATWNSGNTSATARFNKITVNSGITLTIASDLTLHFCEGGNLIIKPNAKVILDGILTSDCNQGWDGVVVQGDGTNHQFLHTGSVAQGQLFCRTNSVIENASTAVRLFGPAYEDAGGQIYATGAKFLNNHRGIQFAPFNNWFPTPDQQRPYRSAIRDCIFDIDDGYLFTSPFTQHISMYSVFGVNILGSYFGNHKYIDGATKGREYGIGILAIDAGFNVGPTAIDMGDEPCLPPCNILHKSTFYGLGIGIAAGRLTFNRPFQVFESNFANCYFGISNYSVSGCNIFYNDFDMGAVQNLDASDEDQVGISLSDYMIGLKVENNTFHLSDEITEHSLGIVVNQLGDFSNVIRNNSFTEITLGDEAFGRNANLPEDPKIRGLHYLCNGNIDVSLNDFYIPEATLYGANYVRKIQGQYMESSIIASGNNFSSTGDVDDGDFGNHGNTTIKYYYKSGVSNEMPIDFYGLDLFFTDPNSCENSPCLEPCLPIAKLDDAKDIFYDDLDNYLSYVGEDDFLTSAYYREQADSVLSSIVQFLSLDTSSFDRDTLREWYLRSGSIAGELLLAGDFFGSADPTNGNKTLDSIPVHFDLTSDQLIDLRRIKYVYSILSSKSVFSMSAGDIDSLRLFSNWIGASSILSRSTLSLIDTIYTPRYYVPDDINPRSSKSSIHKTVAQKTIKVYPNPVKDELFVDLGESKGTVMKIEFYDIDGRTLGKGSLTNGLNRFDLDEFTPDLHGILLYKIVFDGQIVDQNKLIISW